jgi:hypothetical protein
VEEAELSWNPNCRSVDVIGQEGNPHGDGEAVAKTVTQLHLQQGHSERR